MESIKSTIEKNYVPREKYEKLKEENEKLKDVIKKLKEENIKNKGLQISDNCNVWYMNGNAEDLSKWNVYVDNGFVQTWNRGGRNEKLKTKLKVDDIIVWHIKSKGYNSVLKVIDNPKVITDKELKLLYNDKEIKKLKEEMKKKNFEFIIVPVEFLATTDTNFITTIEDYDKDWTRCCRGSTAIKPSNPQWQDQVREIYNQINEKINA
tara:strand:+ start:119 stop:742 length:624 start_codon:yes stop_codon:yes gene_type:complete